MKSGWSPSDEEGKNKLIAKYGGSISDFYSDGPDPDDYHDAPCPDRVLSVTLNEAEQELLMAVFYNAACPEEHVISDNDWDLLVALGKKLGIGDLRQL